MRKYFNRATIIIFLVFVFQSLNVVFCLTHPDVGKFVTCFAVFADGFIFGLLFTMLINSK